MNDETKDELIEKYWDINVDHDWWEFTYDDFKLQMIEKGITVADINFTGFYSQGDGASFTGTIDMKTFLKVHDLEQHYMGATFFAGLGELYANIGRHNSRYSHENTTYIELQQDTYNDYEEDDLRCQVYGQMADVLSDEWQQLDEEVTEICRSYMQDLYSKLREEYESLTSKEVIWETIVANELHEVEEV